MYVPEVITFTRNGSKTQLIRHSISLAFVMDALTFLTAFFVNIRSSYSAKDSLSWINHRPLVPLIDCLYIRVFSIIDQRASASCNKSTDDYSKAAMVYALASAIPSPKKL